MLRRLMLVLGCVLSLGACGNDDDPVSPPVLAGDYTATTLEVVQGTTVTDYLELGGLVDLTLESDSTFASHVILPGAGEGGAVLDTAFVGTWEITGGSVHLSTDADIFLRDVSLVPLDGGRLRGERAFVGATVRIELERQ